MKKTAVCILILTLLVSCASARPPREDDIRQALYEAALYTIDDAFRSFSFAEDISFLPDEAAFLRENFETVPGLGLLCANWDEYVISEAPGIITYCTEALRICYGDIEFDDPEEYLLSQSSITERMRELHSDEIHLLLLQQIKQNIDFSVFDAVIKQYNDYLLIQAALGGDYTEKTVSRFSCDPTRHIAAQFEEIMFSELCRAEINARSIPNLQYDSNYVRVFGL